LPRFAELLSYWEYLEEYYNQKALDYVCAEPNSQVWPLKWVDRADQIATDCRGCGNCLAAAAEFVSSLLFSKYNYIIYISFCLVNFVTTVFDGFKCTKMEDKLMSLLITQSKHLELPSTMLLSHMIKERALSLISTIDNF
jgi:hypothetical protein